MRRREVILLIGGAAIVWPLTVRAQQRPAKSLRIGIIDDAPIWDHFRQGLRDLGYIDGQNITIEYRSADGHEYPRFCGAQGRLAVSAREEGPLQRQVRGLLSPAAKNRFPGAWEAATRDSVRMRQRLICGQVRRAETQFAFESGEAEKYPILCELLH
jgi:hypothetical protein